MSADKLGLGMSAEDKRVEELEYILAGVMHFVDKWLDGDDFEQDEVNRAAIAREKALQAIESRDAKISELRREIKRLDSNLSYAYQYICLLKGDHF